MPLQSEQPVALPKGRSRSFDLRLLAGLLPPDGSSAPFVTTRFVSPGSAMAFDSGRQRVGILRPEEYLFVVLTDRAQRFAALQTADWIRPPADVDELGLASPTGRSANYRMIFPSGDGTLPLPETMLDMTSVGCVLWDDIHPSDLTPGQFRALTDWVHFGGRLILNGPDAAESLSGGPLGDAAPLKYGGKVELGLDSVEELMRAWSVPGDTSLEPQLALLATLENQAATGGEVDPSSVSLDGTSDLLHGRRLGRGCVIQSRFDLTSRWLLGWLSFDSFVNAAILGRPARSYVPIAGRLEQRTDGFAANDFRLATVNTGVRLIARDGAVSLTDPSGAPQRRDFSAPPAEPVSWMLPGAARGHAGWNDLSDVVTLITGLLREEAGISIPPRSFVLNSLAIYLSILVVGNFLLFRMLDRLEWAWWCVPFLAVGAAIWIARGASLDVGFARSQTEINLIELPPGSRRGHVLRLVSLYNSLTSRYDIEFASADASAAPLGILDGAADDDLDAPATIRFPAGAGPVLAGFAVASNRTRLVHAEQILDLGDGLQWQGDRITNRTGLELLDAVVVERPEEGPVRWAMLGMISNGSTTRVRWSDRQPSLSSSELPLQISRVMAPLVGSGAMPKGSLRLVARSETSPEGMRITPQALQRQTATVLVADLRAEPVKITRGDATLLPTRLRRDASEPFSGVLEEDFGDSPSTEGATP